jgi:hypothetical protein
MASTVEMNDGTTPLGRRLPGALRTYAYLSAVVVGLLLGVGLRFVPATASATPDTGGGQGAASTACAAQ